jgi:hypothetical protein
VSTGKWLTKSEGAQLLRNAGNESPNDSVTSQKTEIFEQLGILAMGLMFFILLEVRAGSRAHPNPKYEDALPPKIMHLLLHR